MDFPAPAGELPREPAGTPGTWPRVISIARWPLTALFFAIASIVQTWPLAKHLGSNITVWWFFPYDAWQFLWNLWWVKDSVLAGRNPFHTEQLLYPQGSDLYLHPVTFVSGVLSIPLQLITGDLVLTWNLLALTFFVLAGVGTTLLAHRITGSYLAGILAGFIFAFMPFTMMRFGGHYNIFATWPIPFMLLFLVRFRETGKMRDAVLTGGFWAIITLNWLEFAVDAALFLAIFFAYWTVVYVRRRDRSQLGMLLRGAAVITVVWAVFSSPQLFGAATDLRSGDYFQPTDQAESFSADLLTFVTPSPLWGPGTDPLIGASDSTHLPVGSVENTAFLGGTALLLAFIAMLTVRRNPHRVGVWMIAFFVFLVLALGPYLYIDNSKDLSLLGLEFTLPLPYQIYDQLPLFGDRRVPARMVVFGIMALSILASVGLTVLMDALRKRQHLLAPALAIVAIALVWLEYWSPPIGLRPLLTPAGLEMIRDDPGDFAVVEAPLGRRNGWTYAGDPTGGPLANYYQTIHGKASVGGYLSRTNDEEFDWFIHQPGLHYLACVASCGPQPTGEDLDAALVRRTFEDNGIKYVIVHKLQPDGAGLFYIGEGEVTAMSNYARDVVGMEQIYDDQVIRIFRLGD
jgi:hypothetical protein